MQILEEMYAELMNGPPEVLPSKYWQELNKKNIQQLQGNGFDHFKRTLALNYFTFLIGFQNEQFHYLVKSLSLKNILTSFFKSVWAPRHDFFSIKESIKYNVFTFLLWNFAQKNDPQGLLKCVEEPSLGNPPKIYSRGRLISQDLANSVLEFYSIMDPQVNKSNIKTVMELGAGYGRTLFAFLKIFKNIKAYIVDIPPALFVSQEYLTKQFPHKKTFLFRPFNSFQEVQEEMQKSDLIFLLPHQLELLPDKSVDLFINISSLHEMRINQIRYYFKHIERLTTEYFYFKQWKVSNIPFDNVVIKETDYPIPDSWKQIYHRECRVQTRFFEALYKIS